MDDTIQFTITERGRALLRAFDADEGMFAVTRGNTPPDHVDYTVVTYAWLDDALEEALQCVDLGENDIFCVWEYVGSGWRQILFVVPEHLRVVQIDCEVLE